jgi:AcrR family transcriptional regulator
VIRHFGSKERLIEAAIADAAAAVAETRRVEPGDVEGAVQAIVAHYEAMGDDVVRWLGSAERYPVVARVTEVGASLHREWVREAFAPQLRQIGAAGERRARVATLATLTDVYVWHLLRRREGLGRDTAEAAILVLVERALDRAAAAGAGA